MQCISGRVMKTRQHGALSLLIPLANLCEERVQAEENNSFCCPKDFRGWDGEAGSVQPRGFCRGTFADRLIPVGPQELPHRRAVHDGEGRSLKHPLGAKQHPR